MIKTLIIEGSELALEKPINVEELMVKSDKLKRAHTTLTARFKALGDTDPEAAATRTIDGFLRRGLGHLGDTFVSAKRALLEKLVEIQTKIHGLYRDVLHSRGARFDVDAMRAYYREMQAVFDELGKPIEEVAASTAKTGSDVEGKPIDVVATKVPAGKTVVTADIRFGTLKQRKGFKPFIDEVTGKSGYRARLPKSGGVVEFFVEDGKLSVRSTRNGETTTFKEFDTLGKYKDKPLSTKVMQAHHGCQSELMRAVFGDLYDKNEAPTIWLRDSTGDSPHGLITHAIQNPSQEARLRVGKKTYGMIRDWAVADLKAAGAPDESIRAYVHAMDGYFDAHIRPKLGANAARLTGDLKVY